MDTGARLRGLSPKGTAGLLLAIAVMAALLIGLPPYRWFFVISLGIGIAVAAILFLWHRFRPVSENDVENKRPLGLS
jgi:membrane protein implicated in regulation of membrane protease activity